MNKTKIEKFTSQDYDKIKQFEYLGYTTINRSNQRQNGDSCEPKLKASARTKVTKPIIHPTMEQIESVQCPQTYP